MIIVSQDKKRIVENLNLGIKKPGEYNKNYVIYNTEVGTDLGEYKTEERAKEVLQEITNTFAIEGVQSATYEYADISIKIRQYAKYEMPKE